MKVSVRHWQKKEIQADILLIAAPGAERQFAFMPDERLRRLCVDRAVASDFTGQKGQVTVIYTAGAVSCPRIMLLGLGDSPDLSDLQQAFGEASAALKKMSNKKIAVAIDAIECENNEVEIARVVTEMLCLGFYQYGRFRKSGGCSPSELILYFHRSEDVKSGRRQARAGMIVGNAVNLSRELQNHPGNVLTPRRLADSARKLAGEQDLKCTILGKKEIKALKMEALLAVSAGSAEQPRFVILEYNPQKSKTRPVVLVGKGITFDSGGISIKPSSQMDEMKFDMSGAATVLGTVKAAASLKLKTRIIALLPCAENMPGPASYRPGDIIRASSGTSIEVINTDAEGRLVLADALTYAKRYKPAAVIDLATLTGACVTALGYHASALLGNDQQLIDQLRSAAEQSGERVWQMPLWQDYYDDIKSDYADIKNSAGRPGGLITAAAFLGTFASEYPWAHLDIAGTAWRTSAKGGFAVGGTGVGVRLLIAFLSNLAIE